MHDNTFNGSITNLIRSVELCSICNLRSLPLSCGMKAKQQLMWCILLNMTDDSPEK